MNKYTREALNGLVSEIEGKARENEISESETVRGYAVTARQAAKEITEMMVWYDNPPFASLIKRVAAAWRAK